MSQKPSPVSSELQDLVIQSFGFRLSQLQDRSSQDYFTQSRIFLLKEWLKQEPDLTTLPDGSSILAQLFQSSPVDALEWWRIRGGEAWIGSPATGTTDHPWFQVLSRIHHSPSRFDNDKGPVFRWPKELEPFKAELRQFLEDALEHAMPLREGDTPPKAGKGSPDWNAQAKVVRFLTEDCSLFSAAEKTAWLFKHRGMLVMEDREFPRWVSNAAFTPATLVWTVADYRSPPQQTSLLKVWQAQSREPSAERVLPWLEKHGVDILPFQQNILTREVDAAGDWAQVKKAVEAVPGGWSYQRSGSVRLQWQSCLCDHPEFLRDLLGDPPTQSVLKKVSDAGVGIWSALALGMERAKADGRPIEWPSMKDIERLMEQVPLQLSCGDYLETPLLFRVREATPPWWETFFRRTLAQAPEAWVGAPDAQQAIWASSLLVNLLVKQATNGTQRERTAEQLLLLARAAKEHPEVLTPQTHAVVWLAQKFLASGHSLKTDVSHFLAQDWPEPSAADVGWIEPMMASTPKPSASHPTLSSLQALAKWARLSRTLEQAPEKSKPRL